MAPTGTTKTRGARVTNGSRRPSPQDMPGAKVVNPQRIAKGPIDIAVETIDAEIAREWLKLNVINRTIRKGKFTQFKSDLLNGRWRESLGDPIRFDVEGNLCDGQHRLAALIAVDQEQPGITLTVPVVRGIPVEDKVAIDTGTSRTAGDQLKIAGYKNTNHLAMAAKWSLFWERRQMYTDANVRNVSHGDILDYVEEHPELSDLTQHVANRWKSKIDMPPGYIVTGYKILREIDERVADEFFEKVAEGFGLEKGSPILKLRQVLNTQAKLRVSLPGEIWLSLLFRTWNAYRENKPLRALPLDKADPDNPERRLPVPIPHPF